LRVVLDMNGLFMLERQMLLLLLLVVGECIRADGLMNG
jgi:hypothetical protein